MKALARLLVKLGAKEYAPLAPFCTLKVGGPARYLVFPKNEEQVGQIQRACLEHEMPLHILGGGSNTLFSDLGHDGVVLKLGPEFDHMEVKNQGLEIIASASTSFAKVTKMAVSLGWAHAVGWSGTPGVIGGAVRMNAGTRLGEIKDALARVYGVQNGQAVEFDHDEIQFGYRHTNLPSDLVITKVKLAYDQNQLSAAPELFSQVQDYRIKRKATQPSTASAGSFFKNPYPLFAAQLIENCNIKGLKYKGAQISSLHANFIVNNGGATASDVLYIATIAQKAVFEKFGVVLTPEIRLVGNFMEASPLGTSCFKL